jgi:rubrerythrin
MIDSAYFVEIEDFARQCMGKPLYRMSPKEWALVESWEARGIGLPEVLRGIDVAFQQKREGQIHSLAYCESQVMQAWRTSRPAVEQAPTYVCPGCHVTWSYDERVGQPRQCPQCEEGK